MALTAENTSKFVQAGAVRVHYHEAGSGAPVICVHGGAPGAYGWGNFGRNMDALAERFRTMIIDLPGYGKSDKPVIEGGRYSFYAQVLRHMLDALGIATADFIGLATGGAAVLKLAMDAPERVGRLVLISSAGGLPLMSPTPSEGQKIIGQYYASPGPSLGKMQAYLRMMMYDPALITPDVVEERYQASIDPEVMANPAEGRPGVRVRNEELWRDLEKVPHRTLIVWGRDNRVQTMDNALFMLQRLPDARLYVFGRCGLWVPWEKAEEFNRLVLDFLGQ